MNYSILPEAGWIWPKVSLYLLNSYAGFRYDFEQDDLPSEAPFIITADQAYKLHVNGQYVCRGPMRGAQENWHYDTVDILPFLRKGHNWIAIEAHNPGVSTFSYNHKDTAGMLCSACWDNGVKIASNAKNWKVFRNTAYKHDTAHLSSQLGRMEDLDLRFDDRSWICEEEDYNLPPVMPGMLCMEKAQGAMPWTNLVPRTIPMLQEKYIVPEKITSSGSGICAVSGEPAPGIVLNTAVEFADHELNTIEFDNEPLECKKDADGISFTVPRAGEGRFKIITLDLGADEWLPGVPVFQFENSEEKVIIDIFYHQYLPDGKISFHSHPANGSMVSLASRLHLSSKVKNVELFQIMGVRQLSLVVRENTTPLAVRLKWRTAVYPLDIKGNYFCSDEILNKLYDISVHTQQVCSMDAFVDTPWREQSQWWGDARIQAKNTIFLTGDTRLLKSGISSIAAQKNPIGLTYANAPTKVCGPILPDFSLTWIVTLRDLWFQTGETEHFFKHREQIESIFAYFDAVRNSDGLIQYDKRFWLFEDWSSLPKQNVPTFINLWHIYAEERYLELLENIGSPDEIAELKQKIAQEKAAAEKYLFDKKQQLFLPERDAEGVLTGDASVHDQVLALLLHLCPEAAGSMLQKIVIPCLNGTLATGAQPSSFWATYLLDCAAEYGLQKEAVNYIKNNWSKMIPWGTVWETFKDYEQSELSYSHAWSAHLISHLPELTAGLKQLSPCWEKIRIQIEFILDEVRFELPLPQGILKYSVKGTENNFSAEIVIPQGVNAEIILPGKTIYASGETIRI